MSTPGASSSSSSQPHGENQAEIDGSKDEVHEETRSPEHPELLGLPEESENETSISDNVPELHPSHYLTHLPKHPHCEACQLAKCRKDSAAEKPTKMIATLRL